MDKTIFIACRERKSQKDMIQVLPNEKVKFKLKNAKKNRNR